MYFNNHNLILIINHLYYIYILYHFIVTTMQWNHCKQLENTAQDPVFSLPKSPSRRDPRGRGYPHACSRRERGTSQDDAQTSLTAAGLSKPRLDDPDEPGKPVVTARVRSSRRSRWRKLLLVLFGPDVLKHWRLVLAVLVIGFGLIGVALLGALLERAFTLPQAAAVTATDGASDRDDVDELQDENVPQEVRFRDVRLLVL